MATQTTPPSVDRSLNLGRAFPLRPIRDDVQHVRATAILDQLSDLDEPTPEGHDDFLVLALIVENHETSIYDHPVYAGPERVRNLFEHAGLTQAQLSSGRRSWPNAGLHRLCGASITHQAA